MRVSTGRDRGRAFGNWRVYSAAMVLGPPQMAEA